MTQMMKPKEPKPEDFNNTHPNFTSDHFREALRVWQNWQPTK